MHFASNWTIPLANSRLQVTRVQKEGINSSGVDANIFLLSIFFKNLEEQYLRFYFEKKELWESLQSNLIHSFCSQREHIQEAKHCVNLVTQEQSWNFHALLA